MNPSRSVVCVQYADSPLFSCHRGRRLAGYRLVLSRKNSIIPVVMVVRFGNNPPPSVA